MKKTSAKQKARQFHKRKIFTAIGAVVILLATLAAFLLFLNKKQPDNPPMVTTFKECVMKYGVDKSTPPACNTPDGKTYFEFKTTQKMYDECVQEGGTILEDSCKDKDGKYSLKFPNQVATYNECREGYPHHVTASVPEPYICVDKNGLAFYAGGKNREVNSYEECVGKGGPINKSIPRKCYFDTVVYYQTLKPSHKYLNLPYELKRFEDCVRGGIAEKIGVEGERPWCRAFNKKKYFYDGPKIDSFEDCARVMQFVLLSNPPQCYGPDGTHYIGE